MSQFQNKSFQFNFVKCLVQPGDLETRCAKHHCSNFPGSMSELTSTGLASFQILVTDGYKSNL